MGSLGFRWSYADNLGVLARGADCTNVHLARLIAGVRRAGLDVHDISLASGSSDVLGCEVSPANSHCSGTGKWIARIRSVERMVSSRRRIRGSSVVTSLSWRSAIVVLSQSLTPVSSSRERPTWFLGSHGHLCGWSRGPFAGILCLFRSDWNLEPISFAQHRMRCQSLWKKPSHPY